MRLLRGRARRIGGAIGLLIVVFASVLVWNMVTTRSRQMVVEPIEVVPVDPAAIGRFADSIAIPTISHQNPAKIDAKVFEEFRQFLESNYPRFHEALSVTTGRAFGDERNQSLLFQWNGPDETDALPILLMAHYDVVGVEESTIDQWTHPPFSGEVTEGAIWGRGTLDDKCAVIALCEAAENLLAQGFTPNRTVFFSFGHDEEVGGTYGNKLIAAWMKEQVMRLEFVLDEGGGIFNDVPGLGQPAALVGIGEKGFLTVKLTANLDDTGHSSIPPRETAISILADAIGRLQANPFPSRLSSTDSDSFQLLHRTIKEVYADVVVAPFVVVAGTDASHYDDSVLAKNVYRFAPWRLGQQEIKRIHGINEQISQSDFENMIRFYRRLLQNAAQ